MSLDEAYQKVKQFHIALGIPTSDRPVMLAPTRTQSRCQWLAEEVAELVAAVDAVEQTDALMDIIYLALGGLVEMGIKPNVPFDIVHESNMQKRVSTTEPAQSNDGKV